MRKYQKKEFEDIHKEECEKYIEEKLVYDSFRLFQSEVHEQVKNENPQASMQKLKILI